MAAYDPDTLFADPDEQDDEGNYGPLSIAQRDEAGGGAYAPPAPAGPSAPRSVSPIQTGNRSLDIFRQRLAEGRKAPIDYGERLTDAEPVMAPKPKGPEQGALSDFGDQVWRSTLGLGADLTGAAQMLTQQLGAPEISDWIGKQRQGLEGHMQATLEGMSTAGQQALKQSILNFGSNDPNAPAPHGAGEWIRYAAMNAAGMVPDVALALLPGALVGRVATKAALAASREAGVVLSPAMARAAGELGAKGNAAIQAGLWGTAGAGRAYNDLVTEVDKASEKELRQSPAYSTLRDNGMSDEDARKELIKKLALGLAGEGAAVGAATGAAGGQLLRGGELTGLANTALRRTGLGALEGAGIGGAQGAADTAIAQQAANEATGKPYSGSQIAAGGVGGALGGAALGAAGALAHGRGETPAKPQREGTGDAAIDAGLRAADPMAPAGPVHDSIDYTELGPGAPLDTPIPWGGGGTQETMPLGEPRGQPGVGPSGQGELWAPQQAGPLDTIATMPNPVDTATMPPGAPPQGNLSLGDVPPGRPATPAEPGSQGEMFPPAGGTGALDQAAAQPSATVADQAPTQPLPPASAEMPPATAASPAPPKMGRNALMKALIEAGEDPKNVRNMKTSDMERRYNSLTPDTTTGASAGPATTSVVKGRRATAQQPADAPGVIQTSPERATTEPPSETTSTPAPAGAPRAAEAVPETRVATREEGAATKELKPVQTGESVQAQAPEVAAPAPAHPFKTLTPAEQRAQRKAAMAAPGERMRGATEGVAPAEKGATVVDQEGRRVGVEHEGELTRTDAAKGTPEARTKTVDEITQATRGAVEDAARATVTPLAKSGMPKVMERVMREVDNLLALHDTTPAGVRQAITQWARSDTAPIPGTKTRRADIADQVLRKMTGEGLVSRDFTREARAEQTRDTAGHAEARERASEAAPEDRQTVEAGTRAEEGFERNEGGIEEEAGDEEGSGGQTMDYDLGGRKARKGASLERHGNDILKELLNNTTTPEDARVRFGTHTGKAEYKDIADYVGKEIERVTHPEFEKKALAQVEAAEKDKSLTPRQRQGAVRKAMAEVNRADPDRIQQLRDLHEELTDPVGAAARREAESGQRRLLESRRPVDGISPQASRYIEAVRSPRLNDHVANNMLATERSGVAHTLHDALHTIALHARDAAAPMREYAQRLLKIAPNLHVLSPEGAIRQGRQTRESWEQMRREGTQGYYDPIDPHIVVDPHSGTTAETILHEASHAVTSDYIERLMRVDPDHPDLHALRAIGNELLTQLEQHGGNPRLLGLAEYALSSPHELHTMLMTNPELQAFAASVRTSPEFRRTMRELGHSPGAEGQSVWRGFTNWVRRVMGLKGPASASEATFLDHMLRPLTNLTDSAVEFNRRFLPQDPQLRGAAEPMYFKLNEALGHARPYAREAGSRLGRFASSVVNQFTPTDFLHERYRGLLTPTDRMAFTENPLDRFRNAQEAVEHSARTFFDGNEHDVRKATRAWDGMAKPDQEALGALMNDATIAGARLAGGSNDHLKTPEQKAALSSLQARFNALPEPSRALYKQVLDLHTKFDTVEREAQLRGIMSSAFPDATDAQREAFARTVRSGEAAEKFLARPENSELAKAFPAESQKLVSAVVKMMNVGRVQGDYFPLRRYGDYVVRHGEGDTYGSERYETRGEAEDRVAELNKQGVDNVHQVDISEPGGMRAAVGDHPLLRELEEAVRSNPALKDHAEAISDLAQRMIMRQATQTEAARARRRGIAGASTDAGRVLSSELLETMRRVGYLEHGAERSQALAQMKLVRSDLARHGAPGEAITASRLIHELERRVETHQDPGGVKGNLVRKATSFGFAQNLMSLSHTVVNTLQSNMLATSLMGGRHGAGRAALAFNKALADGAPRLIRAGASNTLRAARGALEAADWNLAHLARDRYIDRGANRSHMERLFDAADKANLIDYSETRQIRDLARGGASIPAETWRRFTEVFAAGNHAMDVANKSATLKAAFDLEMRRTKGDVNQSVAYAVDMARKVMPNYNPYNKARIMTASGSLGRLGAPLMQFKTYGLHMYSLMGNLARQIYRGENRGEALKTMGLILATHSLAAGVLNTIADPLRYIGGAYDAITGAKRPHDYQADIRNWMSDMMGPTAGQALARGLPTLADMSLFRRVGLGDLLSVPELTEFSSKGLLDMVAHATAGASGEGATSAVGGLMKIFQGDPLGGIQDQIPRPIRDIMKGVGLATTGVKDSTGKIIKPPSGIGEAALQGFGIQPATVADFREGRSAVMNAMAEQKDARARLTSAWLQAEPRDRAAIQVQINQYNQANPNARITYSQLLSQLHQRQKDLAAPGGFGLRIPPKQARELAREGRFANY